MAKHTAPTSKALSAPERVVTFREATAITTLSRTTLWRLTRTDPILRDAYVRLTPSRGGLIASGLARYIESRRGRTTEAV